MRRQNGNPASSRDSLRRVCYQVDCDPAVIPAKVRPQDVRLHGCAPTGIQAGFRRNDEVAGIRFFCARLAGRQFCFNPGCLNNPDSAFAGIPLPAALPLLSDRRSSVVLQRPNF